MLGNAILANLEKRDAGQLALLNSTQGMTLLDAVREVKVQQVQDTLWMIDVLNKGNDVLMEKYKFYKDKDLLNGWEITHLAMEGAAMVLNLLDTGAQPVTAVINLIPDAKLGAPTSIGVTIGGSNIGKSSSKFAKFLEKSGVVLSRGSSMAATMGSFQRRKDDWDLKFRIADNEVKQMTSQIESAKLKNAIAEKELDNHDIQSKNAKETDEFMRSKYTSVELYDWTLSQLTTTYFKTYQMVFDAAKRAERAFAFELSVPQPGFISFDYWDSMRKGLCAGERLFCDIKRMDMAYLDQDLREYEISRSISLAQLDPVALIQLRQAGSCFFNIPEAIFDLDFPGHYLRRIKTVSVTIPRVAGPYTSISSTLSLLRSSVRVQNTLSNRKYGRRDNDVRFTDSYGQFQSIVTSSGINDAGLFEANLRDEKYLPFERSGVISSWKMELPVAFKQYDYDTISDVILNVRYTSREGGAILGGQAVAELKQKALDSIALAEGGSGLARLFDVAKEFPDIWYKFLKGTTSVGEDGATSIKQTATLPLTPNRFPYLFSGATISITKIDLFLRIKSEFQATHTADTLTFTLSNAVTAPGDPLQLSPWNAGPGDAVQGKVYRASKEFAKPIGNFFMTGSLSAGAATIDRDAVSQFYLVCHYQVKWS